MQNVLLPFREVSESDFARVGGKAFVLATLLRAGLPVPEGASLTRNPESGEDWSLILNWWRSLGLPPLAVRSSAIDEDSPDRSFAGQHKTFLEIADEPALRSSIPQCFDSIHGDASAAYREHLQTAADAGTGRMSVVLQAMVQPRFAGVYFTRDPRKHGETAAPLLEFVTGLGESLVSGQETPVQWVPGHELPSEASRLGWTRDHAESVHAAGQKIREILGYEADIEWAIDPLGKLWILQARPITVLSQGEKIERAQQREMRRLRAANSADTLWDGQTFAEWTGSPTPLSFDVWRHAFSRSGALGKALHELGYAGSESHELAPREAVLDDVFGRAYVNLSRLEQMYFGAAPFIMVPKPRPHLAFRWRKLTWRALLNSIPGTLKMIRVSWVLSTGRKKILSEARRALAHFERSHRLPTDPGIYAAWDAASLISRWENLAHEFSEDALLHPLKLMVAIESTQQVLLRSVGERVLDQWLGTRLKLPSLELSNQYSEACADPKLRPFFLASHGHRGPGEFDLAKPRWVELGFGASQDSLTNRRENQEAPVVAPRGILARMAEEEWEIFSSMLILREQWKETLMRPYAHLRWIALELGEKLGLGDDIFWLRAIEIRELVALPSRSGAMKKLAERRRERETALRGVSLPLIFQLADLDRAGSVEREKIEKGEALSGGLAFGEIRIVTDPSRVDWSKWPANAILVAEATDPGWTPLFVRSRAVITERGGALSHCAIVAREMGLPAVSGVVGCTRRFKEGENVWVDGYRGSVTRA